MDRHVPLETLRGRGTVMRDGQAVLHDVPYVV
jgi:hypothetical protein